MFINDAVRRELEKLVLDNDGIIKAEQVVAFAKKNPNSAIGRFFIEHNAFDPKHAVKMWSLTLAHNLIRRVYVKIETPERTAVTVRAMVSCQDDRRNGGGYREIKAVLSAAHLRDSMLRAAHEELKAFQKKYGAFTELADVFAAIDRLKKKK